MADLLTFENLTNLLMLCFLQAVLGFDNLLYISIESQRAPVAQQKAVRFWGIIIAVALRVVLLFTMVQLLATLSAPFYTFDFPGIIEGQINFATCVFIFGGLFLIYTAVKEIRHLLVIETVGHDVEGRSGKSAVQVIFLIVLMNLIFSFDSVLSAIAITEVFPILATAIILSGVAMLLLADGVTAFIQRNRMFEVLGLFILLIVGVVLLGEAGQAAVHGLEDMGVPHEEAVEAALRVFGVEIVPMSKATFYFAVIALVVMEVLQMGYSRKLEAERQARGAQRVARAHR